MTDQIASLGSNLVIAMPGQRPGPGSSGTAAPRLKIADARAIEEQLSGLEAVAPTAGQSVRAKLFGAAHPVGSTIRVKQFSCEVIGLLRSKGQASMGRDQDDTVLVPLRTPQRRVSGSQDVGSIMVAATDGTSTDRVKAALERLLRERRTSRRTRRMTSTCWTRRKSRRR